MAFIPAAVFAQCKRRAITQSEKIVIFIAARPSQAACFFFWISTFCSTYHFKALPLIL